MLNRREISIVLHPRHLLDLDAAAEAVQKSGANTIVIFCKWGRVSRQKGIYDFVYYDSLIERLGLMGAQFILRLDCSNRFESDARGELIKGTGFPSWMQALSGIKAVGHTGREGDQFSFGAEIAIQEAEEFYYQAAKHFTQKYPGRIYAFAIALSEENEIKYGQNKYYWRDYHPKVKEEFRERHGADMPVITTANRVKGNTSQIPFFDCFMQFREEKLVQTVKRLSLQLQKGGGKSMGYFGQFFGSHDAIFCLGVIASLRESLDIIAVDYNFYNGWTPACDVWKPALMANYAHSIGYKNIIIGLYLERVRAEGHGINDPVDMNIVEKLNAIGRVSSNQEGVVGYELAGFGRGVSELHSFSGVIERFKIKGQPEVRNTSYRIALLACHDTFYYFVGERSYDRNIHNDALVRAYELLKTDERFSVSVISDRMLVNNPKILEQYEGVVCPHQPAVSNDVLNHLANYIQFGGGVIVQDVRFGMLTPNGERRGHWASNIFGIGDIEWQNGGVFFDDLEQNGATKLSIDKTSDFPFSHALMTAKKGYKITVMEGAKKFVLSTRKGLFLESESTIAMGLMPYLLNGAQKELWCGVFLNRLASKIDKRRVTGPTQHKEKRMSVIQKSIKAVQHLTSKAG